MKLSFYGGDRLIFSRPQLRERLALLKIAEKEEEEEKRDTILKSKVVSASGERYKPGRPQANV